VSSKEVERTKEVDLAKGVPFGNYTLFGRTRREGAHIEAYVACRRGLRRMVEMRVLASSPGIDSPLTKRFFHELQVVSTIDHPGVLIVLDVGFHKGRAYFTTPLRKSLRLREYLERQGGKLSPDDGLRFAEALTDAVAALHRESLIHRAISLDSIFVDLKRTFPYLGECTALRDTRVESLTAHGYPTLIDQALTPESLWSLPEDERSDVYLLCKIFYRFVTGQAPYGEAKANPKALFDAMANIPPLSEHIPSGPLVARLQPIILKGLAVDSKERYSSALELAHDLRLAAQNAEIPLFARNDVILPKSRRKMPEPIVDEAPATADEAPAIVDEAPATADEAPAIVDEAHAIADEAPSIEFDTQSLAEFASASERDNIEIADKEVSAALARKHKARPPGPGEDLPRMSRFRGASPYAATSQKMKGRTGQPFQEKHKKLLVPIGVSLAVLILCVGFMVLGSSSSVVVGEFSNPLPFGKAGKLSYDGTVPGARAKAVADLLARERFYEVFVCTRGHLAKAGGDWIISLVVPNGTFDTQKQIDGVKRLAMVLSARIFDGASVMIMACDATMTASSKLRERGSRRSGFGIGSGLFFDTTMNEDFAKKLGAKLDSFGYFRKSASSLARLTTNGRRIVLHIVVPDGDWYDEKRVEAYRQWAKHLRSTVAKKRRLDVHLCDSLLTARRVLR